MNEPGFRIRVLPVRRAGAETVVLTVLDAVLSGQHRRGHLIVRRQLHEHFGILRPLPEHGVGIGELREPPAHVAEIQPRVLARGQLRGQRLDGKSPERAVSEIKSVCHKKTSDPRHDGRKSEATPESSHAVQTKKTASGDTVFSLKMRMVRSGWPASAPA